MIPALIILAVIVVFLIVVATRPDDFRVTRSATLDAQLAAVFAQVNDFHNWQDWSPWAKLDPNIKNTYEGPSAGKGAIFSWVGNKKVGEGRMTILESRPNELVQIKLEFLKPFKSTNTAEFTFKPEGNQTRINWDMYGPCNFMSKLFTVFMSYDKMIGPDFERGLGNLKNVVAKRV